MQREGWINLNGQWRFAFDRESIGEMAGWHKTSAAQLRADGGPLGRTITVPFCPESSLSGIGDPSFHDVVWYGRTLEAPRTLDSQRVILHFGSVDYGAKVWINGELVASHEGGHTPFKVDLTEFLIQSENTLVVRAEDPGGDPTIPRGKQDWKEHPSSIFYSRSTGIWQTVWLEVVDSMHVDYLLLTPSLDQGQLDVDVHIRGWTGGTHIHLTASLDGRLAGTVSHAASGPHQRVTLKLDQTSLEPWSPQSPAVYDLTVELFDPSGHSRDVVQSYFGLRKVDVLGDELRLNGQPIFLRLVLDQGYWPDGLFTPPSDEAIRRDIELAMAMGFNGARKHQKPEDPRWLYWADRLGFLVWEEMSNAYQFSLPAVARTVREWAEVVIRDYNHPCVIAWVPINESSGCRPLAEDQRSWVGTFADHFPTTMYHLTKTLDPNRPALSNCGWEHTSSDLCTIHDYRNALALTDRVSSLENLLDSPPSIPAVFADGYHYDGQPILISEYGGIFSTKVEGFDYAVAVDADDFARQLEELTSALLASPLVAGFAYTQLADTAHERNGLLTAERKPKIPLERIQSIITLPSARERRLMPRGQ